jgi:rod shape-determining protein MreD
MRWILFLVLGYVVLVAQTSLVQLVTFSTEAAGTVQPDLLALLAALVALYARTGLDAMLAGWALGLAADLTAGKAIGVMPVTYALAASAVWRFREVFFRERLSTRIVLTLLFCLIAHGLWVTAQTLLAWRAMAWGAYGRAMLQAGLLSAYTGVLAAPGGWLLGKALPLVLAAPAGRARR